MGVTVKLIQENSMRIIQTKGIVKDGELKVKVPTEFSNAEVDVIVVARHEPDEFDLRYQLMLEKGYDTPEKVVELIDQIKLEMVKEKGRI
jgi:site-specific recombinase XerD